MLMVFSSVPLCAQIPEGAYLSEPSGPNALQHEIKVAGNYLIHSLYETSPPRFISTMGGSYTLEGTQLEWALEFNSAYEQDAVRSLTVPVRIAEGGLRLQALPKVAQALDGGWLFATRGPDTGQERRGEESSRKTLKFLIDGRFQWIAYDTDSMRFSGSGGGRYEAKDGRYTEHIGYFSRDNARVGATLEFAYEVQGADWHHTGRNSRGEPMYEIWARREVGAE